MFESNPNLNLDGSLASGALMNPVSYTDAIDNYTMNTDWWAVFAAFDLTDMNPSPIWIADHLAMSLNTVIEALEGLVVLGYLTKDSKGYSVIPNKDFIKLEPTALPKPEVIEAHSLISRQIINDLDEQKPLAIDHRCFASNIEILKQLYSDINQAMEKAFEQSKNLKNKDSIFKMSFTATDIIPRRS